MLKKVWRKGNSPTLLVNEKVVLKHRSHKTKIMASGPIISWQINGKTMETVTADGDCSHEIKRLATWKKSYDHPRQHIKKQRHYFAHQGPSGQGDSVSSSHVWM